MHKYFIKTPWIVRKLFPSYIWSIPSSDKVVYLTFDDGPHPEITPWVVNELKKYNALATFFCIGKNVEQYREIFNLLLKEGHTVGNHTFNHLNGWKTENEIYVKDVIMAKELIDSTIFRPPYGKLKVIQSKKIKEILSEKDSRIIMWDVLSGDFDKNFTPEQCYQNVINNVSNGSIIVFHDSEKAFANLHQTLPRILKYFFENKYEFKKL
ncbi:MAG TPA: polysaccharide deacetylase family protein [Candidatus Nitrosocosmicus sp.]|jgi:peptidoglycan/xylan/chitin deacetylase (PgdA/CDA1 family)